MKYFKSAARVIMIFTFLFFSGKAHSQQTNKVSHDSMYFYTNSDEIKYKIAYKEAPDAALYIKNNSNWEISDFGKDPSDHFVIIEFDGENSFESLGREEVYEYLYYMEVEPYFEEEFEPKVEDVVELIFDDIQIYYAKDKNDLHGLFVKENNMYMWAANAVTSEAEIENIVDLIKSIKANEEVIKNTPIKKYTPYEKPAHPLSKVSKSKILSGTGAIYSNFDGLIEGLTNECTGTLIAPNFIITAAYCVYDTDYYRPGYANKIDFYPGKELGKKKYVATEVYIPSNYISKEENSLYNYAIIKIEEAAADDISEYKKIAVSENRYNAFMGISVTYFKNGMYDLVPTNEMLMFSSVDKWTYNSDNINELTPGSIVLIDQQNDIKIYGIKGEGYVTRFSQKEYDEIMKIINGNADNLQIFVSREL